MKLLGLLLVAISMYGGQSLATGSPANNSISAYSKAGPLRIEFYVHDWGTPVDNERVFQTETYGVTCLIAGSGASLRVLPVGDGDVTFDINFSLFTVRQMYVRAQRNPTAGNWTVEAWDSAGVRQYSRTIVIGTITANTTGHYIRGAATSGAVAFWRAHNTLVAENSRPPVTFDNTDRIAEWKFDGSLTASAGGNDLTGAATYVATPGQGVISVPQVNATEWSNQTSIRAGNSATLSGSQSYSQADASNSVTCQWFFISGPSQPLIESSNTCAANPKGTIFGSYVFQLTVTDVASQTASATIEVGAVATDLNGVVIPSDPNVTKIFGEMIAFGKSPWGYMDASAMNAVGWNQERYGSNWADWLNYAPGTVSTSFDYLTAKTTLNGSITATDTSITVTSAAALDLTTFPTIIGIGGFPSYNDEEVLICGVSVNTLTVCFDGRGYGRLATGVNGTAWATATSVYQRRVAGTSSTFLTQFCPSGAGQPGAIVNQTGTVAVTAGSTTITGTGTSWSASNNGQVIRIAGTHSGGTPFVFWATATYSSATAGTLSRIYPSGADTNSGRAFAILGTQKNMSIDYLRTDTTVGRAALGISGCTSDTVMYWRGGLEYLTTVAGAQTARPYAPTSQFVASNNNSYQYYDEVAAGYAMYFRSGWEPARTQARTIGDPWIKAPAIDDGLGLGTPRNVTFTGMFIAAALDGRTDNWYGLRKKAALGASYATNCFGNNSDLREVAYAHSWTSLAAFLDPDSGQRATWIAAMPTALAWDDSCKGAANDYKQYFAGGEAGTPAGGPGQAVNVINGSTAVTGTGIPSTFCLRTAGGTASIVSGASQITGASISIASGAPGNIVISGTSGGNPLILKMQYSGSGTTVALSGVWPGDTGTINFQIESNNFDAESYILSVSPNSTADPAYGKMYACQWNSSSSITLIRPYEGPTGTAYLVLSNLVGVGTQPFIAAIKTKQQQWAVEATSGSTKTSYQINLAGLSNWIYNNGLDAPTGGMVYGVNFANCNPVLTAAAVDGSYNFRNTECNYWPNTGGKQTARPLLAEGASALVAAYQANPTTPVKDAIDQYYANLFGQQYASGVPSAEGGIANEFLYKSSLIFGKWYGFHFGMGMAHQWPAVRLGGAQPEALVSRAVQPRLADISGAASMKVTATRPSGDASSTATCTTSPCTVQIDTRQGTGWLLTIEYYSGASGTGTLLSSATQPAGM